MKQGLDIFENADKHKKYFNKLKIHLNTKQLYLNSAGFSLPLHKLVKSSTAYTILTNPDIINSDNIEMWLQIYADKFNAWPALYRNYSYINNTIAKQQLLKFMFNSLDNNSLTKLISNFQNHQDVYQQIINMLLGKTQFGSEISFLFKQLQALEQILLFNKKYTHQKINYLLVDNNLNDIIKICLDSATTTESKSQITCFFEENKQEIAGYIAEQCLAGKFNSFNAIFEININIFGMQELVDSDETFSEQVPYLIYHCIMKLVNENSISFSKYLPYLSEETLHHFPVSWLRAQHYEEDSLPSEINKLLKKYDEFLASPDIEKAQKIFNNYLPIEVKKIAFTNEVMALAVTKYIANIYSYEDCNKYLNYLVSLINTFDSVKQLLLKGYNVYERSCNLALSISGHLTPECCSSLS